MLVKSLDVPGVAALLVNPDARIRKETLERIVEQAEEIEAWHMPLALRADLSARAIRRIAGFVGAGADRIAGASAAIWTSRPSRISTAACARGWSERPPAPMGCHAEAARRQVAAAQAQWQAG